MKLNVEDRQKNFVAPNANSIAEAYFSQEAWFRAICDEKTLPGAKELLTSDVP